MVAGVVVLLIAALAGLTMMRSGRPETTGALAAPTTSTEASATSAAPTGTAVRLGSAPSSTVPLRTGGAGATSSTSAAPTSATPTTVPPAAAPQTTAPALQPPPPPPPPPAAEPPPPPVVTDAPPPPPPPPPPAAPPVIAPPPPAPVTEPPPPAPKISRFTVAAGDPVLLCMSPSQSPRRFGWASVGGSSATLLVGGVSRQVAPSGSLEVCAGSGQTATLTVGGAGGTASADLVVP